MSRADEFRARQRERRLATCKHFTGIQNEKCKLGIAYAEVRDSSVSPYRWPCTGAECPVVCEWKEPHTPEEIDAQDREREAFFAHMATARERIIATKKPHGETDCPKCGVGSALRFTVSSYNGHVHAACRTKGCLAWME